MSINDQKSCRTSLQAILGASVELTSAPSAMNAKYQDGPRTLENLHYRDERHHRLKELREQKDNRIAPLNEFVDSMRQETGKMVTIPYFDPLDGGMDARVLFLLEAPGRKAVETGFVSQNNPDPTAANLYGFLKAAKIRRDCVLLWNAVPWYVGNGIKIRAANEEDLRSASRWLKSFLGILAEKGKIEMIVTVGNRAADALAHIGVDDEFSRLVPEERRFSMRHPSNQALNPHPEYRIEIKETLRRVASRLSGDCSS
jgi:uracil-DNA glycosylase